MLHKPPTTPRLQPPSQRKVHQRGMFLMGVSIALLAAAIATVGTSRLVLNNFKENIGQSLGVQVQTVATALGLYIVANEAALLAIPAVDVPYVVNDLAPTVAELQNLNFLSRSVRPAPSNGDVYVISVVVNAALGPRPQGRVYLRNPIVAPDGRQSDIRMLGAAMASSVTNQVGFSMPSNAALITGTNWTIANPDPALRAGILLANVPLAGPVLPPAAQQRFWLESMVTEAAMNALPIAGNAVGDVRLNRASQKPMTWNGAAWVDVYARGATNLAIGHSAGDSLTTGSNNTFFGSEAGRSTTGGAPALASGNSFFGRDAGRLNTTGSSNTFMGFGAGLNNTTGTGNVYTGLSAGRFGTAATENVLIGQNAGIQNLGDRNVFLGLNAGRSNTSGNESVMIGSNAGSSTTTASANVFIGSNAGNGSLGGSENIFIGQSSGRFNTNGSFNVFTGVASGQQNSSGSHNVFSGTAAGSSNSTGQDNVFIGRNAGQTNQTGSRNTYIGSESRSPSGTNNVNATSVGYNSQATGDSATAVGAGTIATGANSTAIGAGATVIVANRVRIGNMVVTRISGQVGFSSDSDRRLKSQIQPSDRGLEFIKQLQPVDYTLTASNKPDTGFIAQDVEAVDPTFPGLGLPANSEDFYSLAYTSFIPALVKSVQQLDAKIQALPANAAPAPHWNQPVALGLRWLEWGFFAALLLVMWLLRSLKTQINRHEAALLQLQARVQAL